MSKQRKRENGGTTTVEAQVTICLYMELHWRNCLDKIHYQSHYNLRTYALVLCAVDRKLFIFKIPASGTWF